MRYLRIGFVALALALAVYAAGCKNSKNPVIPGPTTADVTITINGNLGASSYSPSPDTVLVGQTVAWHNSDSMTHTATANSAAFNTGNVGAGSTSAPIAMNSPGSFPYHCSIHPTMSGVLVVH
jgi:plastocyanin